MQLDEKLEIEARHGGVFLSVTRKTSPSDPIKKFEGLFGPASFNGIFTAEEFQDACRSLFKAGISGKNPRVNYQAIVREHQIELLIKLEVFDGYWRIFNFKLASSDEEKEKGSPGAYTGIPVDDIDAPGASYEQTELHDDDSHSERSSPLPEDTPAPPSLKLPSGGVTYDRAGAGSLGAPEDYRPKLKSPTRQRSTQDPSYNTAKVEKIDKPSMSAKPKTKRSESEKAIKSGDTSYDRADSTKIKVPKRVHTAPHRKSSKLYSEDKPASRSPNIPPVKPKRGAGKSKRTPKAALVQDPSSQFLVAETIFIAPTTRYVNVSSEDVASPAPKKERSAGKEDPTAHYSLISSTEVDSPVYRPRGYVGSMIKRADIAKELEKHSGQGVNYYLVRDSWRKETLINGLPDTNLFVISYLQDRPRRLKHHRIYRQGLYFGGANHGERQKCKTIEEYLEIFVKAAKHPIPGFN